MLKETLKELKNKEETRINDLNKGRNYWQDFRERRLVIIDAYLVQKRKQMMINDFIRLMYRH